MEDHRQRVARISRLREILSYNPSTGEVKIKKSGRTLIPDDDGLVYVSDSKSIPRVKRYKLDRLVHILLWAAEPPESCGILHKNLNFRDNRLCNIKVVSKEVLTQVNTAKRNLEGGIKFRPHPSDQYSYILSWYEDGREKSKTFYDEKSLKENIVKLQLINSKILTKWCVFEDA